MGKIRLSSKSSALNYPELKPTLNLNFAASKSLDPRITFTRNSIGTYVGSDGLIKTAVANEPRFDYDPVTGECLGLMVEESRTNYVYPSTTGSSGGSWSNQGAPLISNAGIAPDGTNTAILTAWNTVSGSERIYYNTGTPLYVGVTEIHSFFIKSAEYGSRFTATFQGVNWSWINGLTSSKSFTFDFDAETLSVTGGGISSYGTTVIKYNNGWYRICIPAINNGDGSFANTYVAFNRTNQVGNWYIWGCQREVGTYPTSYIPTSGSIVTRQADVAQITGTNFSSWYNSTEGTLLSIGEENSHKISSNTLTISSNSSSKDVVSNILYYPKTIQYPTLKTMNAYPPIVSDGLVLHLDAGLKKSYVGVGTFWNDLSGNGNTGTLINGPTYSSSNGGSIVFDGVDDYVTVPSTNSLYLAGTSQVSVSCWGRTNNVNIQNQNLVMWEDIVDSDNLEPIRLSINGLAASNSSFNPIFSVVNSSDIGANIVGVSTVINSTYYNLVGTYDGATAKLYINGILNNQVSFSGNFRTPTSETSARWIIGRGEVSRADRLLNGNIAQVSIYNRALTAAEIQQNFNALRGRFGL